MWDDNFRLARPCPDCSCSLALRYLEIAQEQKQERPKKGNLSVQLVVDPKRKTFHLGHRCPSLSPRKGWWEGRNAEINACKRPISNEQEITPVRRHWRMGKCALGTGAYGVPAPQDYRREPIHRWAEKDGVPLLFLYVAIDSKKTQCVSLFFST